MPGSFDAINKTAGTVANTAGPLSAQNTPGADNIRQTLNALLFGPQTSLPGGGTLQTGRLQQQEQTEQPAATLGLTQADPARKLGLAGAQAGAGQLNTESQNMGTQYSAAIQQLLTSLMRGVGSPPLGAGAVGGGFGLLSGLLGV